MSIKATIANLFGMHLLATTDIKKPATQMTDNLVYLSKCDLCQNYTEKGTIILTKDRMRDYSVCIHCFEPIEKILNQKGE